MILKMPVSPSALSKFVDLERTVNIFPAFGCQARTLCFQGFKGSDGEIVAHFTFCGDGYNCRAEQLADWDFLEQMYFAQDELRPFYRMVRSGTS